MDACVLAMPYTAMLERRDLERSALGLIYGYSLVWKELMRGQRSSSSLSDNSYTMPVIGWEPDLPAQESSRWYVWSLLMMKTSHRLVGSTFSGRRQHHFSAIILFSPPLVSARSQSHSHICNGHTCDANGIAKQILMKAWSRSWALVPIGTVEKEEHDLYP